MSGPLDKIIENKVLPSEEAGQLAGEENSLPVGDCIVQALEGLSDQPETDSKPLDGADFDDRTPESLTPIPLPPAVGATPPDRKVRNAQRPGVHKSWVQRNKMMVAIAGATLLITVGITCDASRGGRTFKSAVKAVQKALSKPSPAP